MTTPEPLLTESEIPVAAELALGVLDGDDRAIAMRRVLAEPEFAREVEAWRGHFAMLFAEWPEADVDPMVGSRVIETIEGPMGSQIAGVVPPPRHNRWAWATGVATLAAASLVLALAVRPERIVTTPAKPALIEAAPLVAAIAPSTTGGQDKPFAAIYDAKRGEIRLTGVVTVPSGRSAELWSIGVDSKPHPLGVFDGGSSARITIGGRSLARIVEGVTLAVSIEPVGGSPTGKPTGPVVATGVLSRV